MKYEVLVAQEAEDDLVALHGYVAAAQSVERAGHVVEKLLATCRGLERLPNRGHVLPELRRVGVMEFRELHWKPYRIVYEVAGKRVVVHAILDGRRDLPELLVQRILR